MAIAGIRQSEALCNAFDSFDADPRRITDVAGDLGSVRIDTVVGRNSVAVQTSAQE